MVSSFQLLLFCHCSWILVQTAHCLSTVLKQIFLCICHCVLHYLLHRLWCQFMSQSSLQRSPAGSLLALAGTELVFFRAARMVLCFGFVAETALTTTFWQLLNSLCRAPRLSLSHSAPPRVSRLGVRKRLERYTASRAGIHWPEEYSMMYDIML